jgi:hypothetical protein
MKKLESVFQSININDIKIFLDDLELLIDEIENLELTYTLEDSEFEYESLEELKSKKGINPKEVKFNIRNPKETFGFITIKLINGSVYINAYSDKKLIDFANSLEIFFSKRKKNWIYIFLNNELAIFNIIFNLFFFAMFTCYNYYYKKEFDFSISLFITLFWVIIFIVSFFLPKGDSNIELEREHQKNILKNNKEKIGIGLLILFLFSVIGKIIQWLSQNN